LIFVNFYLKNVDLKISVEEKILVKNYLDLQHFERERERERGERERGGSE
jgi:hypothetical protein